MKRQDKPELNAAVRDMKTLRTAVLAGADTIEIVGEDFGFLSATSHRFTGEEIQNAVSFVKEKGAKLFVAVNLIAHNRDLDALRKFLKELEQAGVDGVIVADPGVLLTVKETAPGLAIHINMEMAITNWESARFWAKAGAERIVLARELSFANIKEICEHVPVGVESQVQGAMNIFYTGRPILSNYHNYQDRPLEKSDEITSYAIREEKRSDEYFPVYEDERGTYVMSSSDLCLIEYIPELVESQLASLRIETRPHGIEYVRTVVSAYREAVDLYWKDPKGYRSQPNWLQDIQRVSKRPLTEGFYTKEAAR